MNATLAETFIRAIIPELEKIAEPQRVYGFFQGGDPRDFSPDAEASSEAERAAHKAACGAFTADKPLPGCCEHVKDDKGKMVMILTKAPFGLGINNYQDEDAARFLVMARAALEEI